MIFNCLHCIFSAQFITTLQDHIEIKHGDSDKLDGIRRSPGFAPPKTVVYSSHAKKVKRQRSEVWEVKEDFKEATVENYPFAFIDCDETEEKKQIYIVHDEETEEANENEEKDYDDMPAFACLKCEYTSNDENLLKSHKKSMHKPIGTFKSILKTKLDYGFS